MSLHGAESCALLLVETEDIMLSFDLLSSVMESRVPKEDEFEIAQMDVLRRREQRRRFAGNRGFVEMLP